MQHFKAPQTYRLTKPSVFLAGSIEQGKAEDWQEAVAQTLQDEDLIILNPRRAIWDATWDQGMKNLQFRQQVEWELNGLERATYILFYFLPDTLSPISLMELGLFKDKKVLVCCPDGYWRKGNIEVVCKKYKIPLFDRLEDMMKRFRKDLKKK